MKNHKTPLMTISRFAELCGTTRQTLQYYDKMGLLHPIYTGKQGYRYYNAMQRYDFLMISTLKQSGCSLDEIKKITGQKGWGSILPELADKNRKLEL
jgi:DNA-binding transcriptional MerR regulator